MFLYLWVFTICLGLLLLFAEREARFAAGWSATWGVVAGVWIVAPRLLFVQHIVARGAAAWLAFDGLLLLTFGAIGALLGIVCTVPFTAIRFQRRTKSKNPIWVNALWPAAALPFVYFAASKSIEWVAFGRVDPIPDLGLVPVYLAIYLLLVAVLALSYQGPGSNLAKTQGLWRALATGAVVGLLVLPYRGPDLEYAASKAPPLRQEPGRTPPLLVIGLDGGNWRSIQPLVEAGKLPNFARLMRSGAVGDMEAKWPPYWSAPAWASMVTGYDGNQTGVHEDLAAYAPLLPGFELSMSIDPLLNPVYAVEYAMLQGGVIQTMPATREMLRRVPVWERLSAAGLRTAVIRFPFTYPAAKQADFVVSNRTVTDLWDMMGVRTGEHDALMWPLSVGDRLRHKLDEPESVDEPIVRALVNRTDWPQPFDSQVNPIGVLRRAVHVQRMMHDATLDAIRQQQRPEVVMLYIAGLDNLSHAFWQYRHPEDYETMPPVPAPADVEQLGPVLDRYLEWTDSQIGELIAAFGTQPNVLIVSDHGEGATNSFALWRGWHTAKGIFIASGPSVPSTRARLDVQYTDVAPTILALLDMRPASDLEGHVSVAVNHHGDPSKRVTAVSNIAMNLVHGSSSDLQRQ
jgi:hypothetical protein